VIPKDLPFVSVVVISRDRHELLQQTVDSLLALDYPPANYEIIIVEEGDAPQPIEGVNYVFLPRCNIGLGYARNTGVRNTKGGIIAFTDDDCLHEKNWLTLMVNTFVENNAGGVAGATLAPPGNLIGKCEEIMGYPGGGLKRVLKAKGQIEKTNLLSGCNCIYMKKVFEDFQYKEDSFGKLGGDDFLLGLEVSKKYGSFFNPDAIIYHKPRGNLIKIITWFYRRRINEYLMKEYESGGKGIRILMGEFRTLILVRLFLWVALTVGLGLAGFTLGILGILGILGVTVYRHLPGIKHHGDLRLLVVLPIVKLVMDLGILKAEWHYLFFANKIHERSLKEYDRK
jgi:glycosyltransferase involved in cell wall biosynthesis